MSFTARQLHCLNAMGYVAWTAKDESVPARQKYPTVQVATAQVKDSLSADELGQWLVRQPLLQLTYKGGQTNCIGSDQAGLIVVSLQVRASGSVPLARESAQLLDLMLRAIDIPRTGFRQCAMLTSPSGPADDSGARLDDVLTAQTRAVLVLDPHLDAQADNAESDKGLLPQCAVPLWRAPHPDLLLATPALKRRAWEALKGLKRVLHE